MYTYTYNNTDEKRDADAMCECGSPALREEYMGWTVCWDCAMFIGAYDCTPDCRTRAKCWQVGPTHTLCGTCYTCFKPNHHCNCKEDN